MADFTRDENTSLIVSFADGRYSILQQGFPITLWSERDFLWAPPPGESVLAVRETGDAGFAVLTGTGYGEGASWTDFRFGGDGLVTGARAITDAFGTAGLELDYGLDLDNDGSVGDAAAETVLESSSVSIIRLNEGGLGVLDGDRIAPLVTDDGTPWRPGPDQNITGVSPSGTGYSILVEKDAGDGRAVEEYSVSSGGTIIGGSATSAEGSNAQQADSATFFGSQGAAGASDDGNAGPTLLVKFAPDASAADIAAAVSAVGGAFGDIVRGPGSPFETGGVLQKIGLGGGLDPELAIEILSRLPGVEYAERNWTVSIEGFSVEASSNDPYYTDGDLWGMYGDDTSPQNVYGSQAADAWLTGQTGSMSSVVGVIDTGIDPTHVDLYLNIWLNQEEIPAALLGSLDDIDSDGLITFRDLNHSSNAAHVTDVNGNGRIDARDLLNDALWADGVDTDGNGFVDDFYGWDFINGDNDPFDDHGHGTHVSGTIGGLGNNGTGVAGVSWGVQMMALKFLSSSGSGDIADAVQAADYFTAESLNSPGQHFVATNNSWGGGGFSQSMLDAITSGALNDILFAAAAGNGHWLFGFGLDNDTNAHYPSNYDTTASAGYDAVIAVASITSSGGISSFSNYGDVTVDLGAPGSGIWSTTPGDGYASYSGTSMATPHVTGALALAASIDPDMTAEELRSALLASTTYTSSLDGKTVTDGRLNVDTLVDGMGSAGPTQTVQITSATDDVGTVQGSLSSGATTDDTTPTLNGTLSAELQSGEVLAVYRGGTKLGNATVTGTTWTFAVATLVEGAHAFAARVEDSSGGAGALSASFNLTVDLTAPIVTVDALVTNDATPALTGTVDDATATVQVTVGSQTLAATNNGDGTWTLSDDALSALGDGVYDVAATATDPAGNAGNDGTAGELEIDTTAPAAPTVNALTTNDTTPTLTGGVTLAEGETLSVQVNGVDYTEGDGLTVSGSTWELTVDAPLSDGTYNVTATVTDAAGNATEDATSAELVIDTTGPDVAITGITNDSGVSGSDFLTSDTTLVFRGTAEPGALVSLKLNGTAIGSDTADASGLWSVDHTGTTLADGTYTLEASASDSSNTTTVSQSVTVDTQGPSVASITLADTVLSVGESTTVTFSFSEAVSGFEAGDVDLSGAGGGTLGALSSVDGGLTWTGTFTPSDGVELDLASIAVTSGSYTDPAGNAGAAGSSDGFKIDTQAPTVMPDVTDAAPVDSGVEITGTVGTLASGETLWVLRDGTKIGEAVVSGSDWSFIDTGAVEGVTYVYSALVEDSVGNQGPAAEGYEYPVPSGDSFIFGTDGSDTLVGTDAAETISGLPAAGSTALGAGTIDSLTGNGGADVFILGDSRGAFYDDGNSRAGNNGKSDYAQIEDFDISDDRIQLYGSVGDYLIVAWDNGSGIFLDNGDGSFDKRDELIGVIANVDPSSLDLSGAEFIYVL